MPQISADYASSLDLLVRLLNKMVVEQKAIERLLKSRGVTDEEWKQERDQAENSIGVATFASANTQTLEQTLMHLLKLK